MHTDAPRPRILACGAFDPAGLTLLQQFADVDHLQHYTDDDVSSRIAEYEGLLVRQPFQVPAPLIERGLRLKVIGTTSAGLDHIDVAAAQAADIAVVNSPDVLTIAIAEHTMGLLLAVARRLPRANLSLKQGRWETQAFVGTGLASKTLGIVGFGPIGRQVAIRARAFGMRILVNQVRPTPELTLQDEVESVDLHALLAQSDFVSLHVPLREDTHHVIDSASLARMKPSAYLVNTSSEGLIDATALLDALNQQVIAGAAVDLSAPPAADDPLVQHEHMLVTPRIATRTEEAARATSISVAEQMLDILRGIEVENVLPLRVVDLNKVIPHESIDPRRVDRLAQRLEAEGILVNPPIVTAVNNKYMVLDGATRTAALKKLGYPHAIVQLSSSAQGLGLQTWHHVIQNVAADVLTQLLAELPDISLVPVAVDKAREQMFEYGALCYVHLRNGDTYLVHATVGSNRLDALNGLTESYIAAGVVDRTLETRMSVLETEYPQLAALVVFQEYTVSQVMQVTLSGRYFPAGLTRFIIPGRVLRLNANLATMRSKASLREKNRWLTELLLAKLADNQIRYYAEPVYLLDE